MSAIRVRVQILTKCFQLAESQAAWIKGRISGDSLDWIFSRLQRCSCWLTVAALRIEAVLRSISAKPSSVFGGVPPKPVSGDPIVSGRAGLSPSGLKRSRPRYGFFARPMKHPKRCGANASHRSPKDRQCMECGGRGQRRYRFGFFREAKVAMPIAGFPQ